MTTQLFLTSLLIGGASILSAQTTLNVKVAAALDDHQEHITGALPQNGTTGAMYVGSTVLNLGSETPTSNPVLVGLRFTNITIPKYATITNAYIQFNVQGTNNIDPCSLSIYAEDNANPATFSDNSTSLSGRTMASGSVAWSVSGTSWNTVGSATADQRTPNIKTLLTPLVYKSNWAPGNAMALYIKGPGMRQVYAFEGDPTKAAELVVTYSTSGTSTVVTGFAELSQASSAVVYPNPFKNEFHVNVAVETPGDVQIAVYDITGKCVEAKNYAQVETGTLTYSSCAQLQAGMYFVKIQANNRQEVIKLISE